MSKKRPGSTALRFAPQVKRRHGVIFAKFWCSLSLRTEIASEAFGLTDVIEWPEEPENDTPAKTRYGCLQDEIVWRALDEAEDVIAAVFIRVAADVIARERAKDRRP